MSDIQRSRQAPPSASRSAWLAVVGINEDGVAGLGAAARSAVSEADYVFGGARHLALAEPLILGAAEQWSLPLERSLARVEALRGERVAVLASGDPFCYGIGSVLARRIAIDEMRVYPAPSAYSLACARLGWAQQTTELVSLHGRPLARIDPHLREGARLVVLTSDAEAPGLIIERLRSLGCGASLVVLLEALGGPRERVRRFRVDDFSLAAGQVDPLNLLAFEIHRDRSSRPRLGVGRRIDCFEHDGQITSLELRALTLSRLAPRDGDRLWDLGAGAGSVAIEWLAIDPGLDAVAVEANPARVAAIARNAARFGCERLEIIEGRMPQVLARLEGRPEAIFIGGGASEPATFEFALAALAPGGRLVANAVTLESEAMLLERFRLLGGELTRVGIERAEPLGKMSGWRPARSVIQWYWCKPWNSEEPA
ncbi:bifunctional cobalt-precorrin-7 (C(5))-methyltransferase/cobalt-precorrin-6B (C(15))-methyltransferase [Halotalea alkalilenta]|uniref:Precorrin-6Y methyltransferase n=1 Tax=Halotalea alkalilenta TaxID=376489 RepID=A0A172YD40_9GAMM|nr:bifunctional cobalt-precorrin-7 (C(5))-methyltransferase/cobalt-precorrin-6B (C(15))-methyltransferase [Halotalea alkalilenta]ANF56915.1 precorrin-6Y methyltransferase [Halotalea alkalilenta]